MSEDKYSYSNGSGWVSSLMWMVSGGAIAAVLLIGLANRQLSDRFLAAVGQLLNPPQPQPKVDVRSLVLQQVREASELTTAAFTMQAVVPTEQDATFSGFVIGKTKLLYIAYGEIKAGVDLRQITAESVQSTGDRIHIQLPAAQILDKKIDINRSQVYDYNRGFLGLGPDSGPNLQTLAQQEALKQIATAACEEGLLQRASDRAKLVVTQLFNTAGYQAVTVETQPVSVQACLNHLTSATQTAPRPTETSVPVAPVRSALEQ